VTWNLARPKPGANTARQQNPTLLPRGTAKTETP
jgi:hypothetical protein